MSIFVQWENNKTPLNAENLNVINDVARQLGEDVAHLSDVVVDIDENFSAKVQNELTEVKSSINTINETTSRLQQQTSSNNTNITNIQRTIADNNSALEEKINTNKNNLTTLQSVVNDNKTELDSKITTNKNNLNTLQQNVNNINSTLDGKIATNKDNISNIQNNLLTGQYTSYSGTNLICNDTLSSKTSNMVIKGQTYQNLLNRIAAGGNCTINDTTININCTDGTWSLCNVYLNPLLVNSKTYTVILNCISLNTPNGVFEMSGFNNNDWETGTNIKQGINKFIIKNLDISMIKIQTNTRGNSASIDKNIIILEGDWTNKEVPSSITGIESVGEKENNKISILSHGKNLFNIDTWIGCNFIGGDISINNGVVTLEAVSQPDCYTNTGATGSPVCSETERKYLIKVKPSTQYTLNCDIIGNATIKNYIQMYDNSFNSVQMVGFTNNATFTTNDNVFYLGFRVGVVQQGVVIKYKNIILAENDTSYEPYKEDKKEILLPVDGGLKSLPNGTCDTIEQRDDGVYLVQRIGKIILNGNEEWGKSGMDWSNTGGWVFYLASEQFVKKGSSLICDKLPSITSDATFDQISDIEGITVDKRVGEFRIFKKGATSVEELKTWLQANPLTVYCELATPIETKLDTKDINIETFDDLTYVLTNNNIQPELEFKIPSNLGALIQNNAKKINELFKLIDELIIPQLTTNTSNIAVLQITK